jgi:metal-responsive CopG/Arc/MetJ family transcriptional regulator
MPRTTHWTPVGARFDDETLAGLDECAQAEGATRSEVLRKAVAAYVAAHRRRTKRQQNSQTRP